MDELKPCPFCGGSVKIVLCDDEGNLHDEDYALRPYSGVDFKIRHTHEENPECPVAQYEEDGGIVGGVYIYDTEEQATESWNKRVNDAEVRLGQWEMYTDEHGKHARCSVCGDEFACLVTSNTITYYRPNYCPTCGTRMDGGDTDGGKDEDANE